MKKHALCAAIAAIFSMTSHAQSSVILYGVIDEGLMFNSNAGGHRLYNMASGVLQGNRFGLSGTEDLGGGLKARFVLENGFDPSTGRANQGGLMFGRQAYVGLSSQQFGTVTLGRQYDSVIDYVGVLGAADQWGGYILAHPGDLDNFNTAYRTNNTIRYASQSYGGLTFGGTYSLGGTAGQFTQNQIWSLGAGYTSGSLALGVGYLNARTPSNVGGIFGNNTATATPSVVTNPVYGGYVSANTYQVIGASGAYTFGDATIGATYSNVKFMNIGANGSSAFRAGSSATFNNAEVSLRYQFTPALLVGAMFDYTRGSSVALASGTTDDGAKYYQGAVVVDYFLSKRTDVSLMGVFQKASGTDSKDQQAVASINNLMPSSSDRQGVVRIGLRHRF
jgi:predicted porin